MFPPHWSQFLEKHGLVHKDVSIPQEADLSGLGADLYLFDLSQAQEEATQAYPGITVARDGFVPVAGCATGSGDPYFINSKDGPNGPLYRIYHDSVGDDGYVADAAIDVVLRDYADLPRYADA